MAWDRSGAACAWDEDYAYLVAASEPCGCEFGQLSDKLIWYSPFRWSRSIHYICFGFDHWVEAIHRRVVHIIYIRRAVIASARIDVKQLVGIVEDGGVEYDVIGVNVVGRDDDGES